MTNTQSVLSYGMDRGIGNNNTKQQQMQQYKSNTQTHIRVKKRILIVNSEDDVNLALKLALEEENGFQVDSFNNPISALENFKNGFYDLLILGIVMPQMNGFELSEKIRRIGDKVKICFLTAGEIPGKVRFDMSSRQGEGYQDKFIRLPIENKVLIERIDRIIIYS
jgi:DNA-binding response OmpR family regulator